MTSLKTAPAGFQRWPLIWFQCPQCGHRGYAPVGQMRIPVGQRRLMRFWCDRCGGLAVLKGPRWLPALLALCALGASLAALYLALGFLPGQSDIAVLIGFGVFLAAWAALTRLGNRYAPDDAG
jgi:hypothetical protein